MFCFTCLFCLFACFFIIYFNDDIYLTFSNEQTIWGDAEDELLTGMQRNGH